MSQFNPSACDIVRARITSFSGKIEREITPLIAGFEITQSLDSVSYRGMLKVVDNVGLAENFVLRGEERLDLEIKAHDLGTVIKLRAQIYKIDGVESTNSLNGLSYNLHFISRINYEASKKKVITSFANAKASYVAEQVFRRYFNDLAPGTSSDTVKEDIPFDGKKFNIVGDPGRKFYLQPTEGELKVVIPNYIPTQAMYFLSMKSYSRNSPSSSFRFFENYNGFYFVTDEFLIQSAVKNSRVIRLIYRPYGSLDPRDAELQTQMIEGFSNPNRADTAFDLFSGGYRNKIVEIDLVRRKAIERNFDYLNNLKYFGMNGNQISLANDIHTEEFIRETFDDNNAKRFMVFRDYAQPGDIPGTLRADQHFAEIASNRVMYQHHLKTTSVNVFLKGRLDIQAGNVVNIDAKTFTPTDRKENNPQLSGNYLVHTVSHVAENGNLKTSLVLIKYNWDINE